MDSVERKRFWDTLCSLKGINIIEDSKKIKDTIIYPRFLYRYRQLSLSSIDALQTNLLYFSQANYYDDPFDTIININFNEIYNYAEELFQFDNIDFEIDRFAKLLNVNQVDRIAAKSIITNNTPSEVAKEIVEYIRYNYRSILKKELWSICFSESGINETMWIKYADKYKGFCLVYDMDDGAKMICGSEEKCNGCIVNQAGFSLYPMYYSDDGYDATNFLKNYSVIDLAMKHLNPNATNMIIKAVPEMPWEQERITLNKSKCHEYDREWRMLLRDKTSSKVSMEWIPHGVILGLKMEEQDKRLVIRSAKIAGINHIYDLYINDNARLGVKEINI